MSHLQTRVGPRMETSEGGLVETVLATLFFLVFGRKDDWRDDDDEDEDEDDD